MGLEIKVTMLINIIDKSFHSILRRHNNSNHLSSSYGNCRISYLISDMIEKTYIVYLAQNIVFTIFNRYLYLYIQSFLQDNY